ncbi:MAG: cation-translocating P-type ATPase [Bacteroidota bacterium]
MNHSGKAQPTNWHSKSIQEIQSKLETDYNKGLSTDEISTRKKTYGKNEMPKAKSKTWIERFILQFNNVFIYILLASAIITALTQHWVDTWVILGVVIINAIIGIIQEGKAEKALEGIRKMLSLNAVVIRNNRQEKIDALELVPGDIVLLQSGDKVPADVRLIETKNLQIEESPLTGESTAVDKTTEQVDESAIIGDQKGMAFSGTTVIFGKAKAVVVETGKQTQIGRINEMMSKVDKITTPLIQQIEHFSKILSVILIFVTAAFFAFGYYYRNYAIDELFMITIGFIVAAIPEGLPAIMTITLAVGVQQMAKRNAIIRKLPSVETLGAVNVICSDKTGTLTQNEMTAKTIITAEKAFTIDGTGYEPTGEIKLNKEAVNLENEPVLNQLIQTLKASNNADINQDENGKWITSGAPTEAALLVLSHKAGLQNFAPKRIDTIPFESEHKFMATLNKHNNEKYVFMTGAPERVIDRCDRQLTSQGAQKIDTPFWENKIKEVAAKGQRMIGVAYKKVSSDTQTIAIDSIDNNQVFLGVIGIIDPPRKEVKEAIKSCKNAGVEVKMITGDHLITAQAIGNEVGITNKKDAAISGHEIEKMSDEELQKAVEKYDIFARTSPEHKLRLVKAIQANGKLCAMTGDGVNDAPALKKANIGIAMGIKGTEVTKDASEMVLADDNFTSIVNAIEEGRTVYDNIKKALFFVLPTSIAESLVVMTSIILGVISPIMPVQILWVNMVTAVTLAMAISFEPKEENVMQRPPRKSTDAILGRAFVWKIVYVSLLIGALTLGVFYWMQDLGLSLVASRTVAVNTLVAGQLFYLFNCRRLKDPAISKGFFSNKYVFYAAGILTVLQGLFVYLPSFNTFFDTEPIKLIYWLPPFAAGFIVFVVVEIEKYIYRKRQAASKNSN